MEHELGTLIALDTASPAVTVIEVARSRIRENLAVFRGGQRPPTFEFVFFNLFRISRLGFGCGSAALEYVGTATAVSPSDFMFQGGRGLIEIVTPVRRET
jgi:hypothetical protein